MTPLNPQHDMHPADVIAAVRKAGTSLRQLSLAHGYAADTASKVLRRPWPALERIIADALGREPWEIWPSRYTEDRQPRRAAPRTKGRSNRRGRARRTRSDRRTKPRRVVPDRRTEPTPPTQDGQP